MTRIPQSFLPVPELLTASQLELDCAIPQRGAGLSHTLTPVLLPHHFVIFSCLVISWYVSNLKIKKLCCILYIDLVIKKHFFLLK